MPHEERAEQGRDMEPVRISIGEDADLAVAELGEVGALRIRPERDRDVADLVVGHDFVIVRVPGVEDLAAQGQYCLVLRIARLAGGASCRVSLDDEELAARDVVAVAVGELPREHRSLALLLPDYGPCRADALLRRGDEEVDELRGLVSPRVEPEAEGVLNEGLDGGRGLPVRELLLGLPGKLRLRDLAGEHIGGVRRDVIGDELHAAGKEVPEVAVLPDRVKDALPEAVHMGAAEHGRDKVDVGLRDLGLALRYPADGPVGDDAVKLALAGEGLRGNDRDILKGLAEVLIESLTEAPLVLLAGIFILEGDGEVRAEHCLGLEEVAEARGEELRGVKVPGIRPEPDAGPGVLLTAGAGLMEGLGHVTA